MDFFKNLLLKVTKATTGHEDFRSDFVTLRGPPSVF